MTFEARLLALERKSDVRDVTLTFKDGSTRRVRIRDPLAVLCDVWSKRHANIVGQTAPETAHDSLIVLLSRASAIESAGDTFLDLLWEESSKINSQEEKCEAAT